MTKKLIVMAIAVVLVAIATMAVKVNYDSSDDTSFISSGWVSKSWSSDIRPAEYMEEYR